MNLITKLIVSIVFKRIDELQRDPAKIPPMIKELLLEIRDAINGMYPGE